VSCQVVNVEFAVIIMNLNALKKNANVV